MKFVLMLILTLPLSLWGQTDTEKDGLVMHLDQGRGEIIIDSSPEENHATCQNGAAYRTATKYTEIYFDGYNDFLEVKNSNSLRFIDEFSITLWINPKLLNKWQCLLSLAENENHHHLYAYNLYLSNANKIRFIIGTGKQHIELHSTSTVADNSWTHIVAVFSGNTLVIYINGKKDSEKITNNKKNEKLVTPKNSLYIGTISSNNSYQYEGFMSKIKLYNRAFSVEEVQKEFNRNSELFNKQLIASTPTVSDLMKRIEELEKKNKK